MTGTSSIAYWTSTSASSKRHMPWRTIVDVGGDVRRAITALALADRAAVSGPPAPDRPHNQAVGLTPSATSAPQRRSVI